MSNIRRNGTLLICCGILFIGMSASPLYPGRDETSTLEIGGAPIVKLTRPTPKQADKPQFVEATILPGEGMNVFQVKAAWPGTGVIDILHSPGLSDAKRQLESDKNQFGNLAFSFGGAILLPFANRIRGEVSPDKKTISAEIAGRDLQLPANWKGKESGAEVHAIHGFIYATPFEEVKTVSDAPESSVSANLHAGNFDGHWPSLTDVSVKIVLKDSAFDIDVMAKNVGKEALPMAIGMHPYFVIPSGDRQQARLKLSAETRALANNYDDVFPTGKLQAVKGSAYDFTANTGAALGKLYLDDCFTDLRRNPNGSAVIEMIDPAAHYGLRITTLSERIHSVQVYAPPEHDFIAIEPQFNLADPFDKKVWGTRDTGIDYLAPGASANWHIRLELFVPPVQ